MQKRSKEIAKHIDTENVTYLKMVQIFFNLGIFKHYSSDNRESKANRYHQQKRMANEVSSLF